MKRYNKWMNRLSRILLCFLIAVFLMPQTASAIDKIKEGADVSVSVLYGTAEHPVVGAKVNLYKVADVYGFGEFVPTKEFNSYSLQWNELDSAQWKTLAGTLESYIAADQIKPSDTGVTDKNGRIEFPSNSKTMTTALYLITSDSYVYENKVYALQPTLICLPNRDSNDVWNYEEDVQLKYEWTDEVSEVQVRKIWSGDNVKNRPNSVTVELYRGSELYDTVVLDKKNDWHYTWKDLKTAYDWKIVEKNVPNGYTVSVERDGNNFIVKNTYKTPSSNASKLPQTGMLWWPVPILAGVGIVLFLGGWLKRRKDNENE